LIQIKDAGRGKPEPSATESERPEDGMSDRKAKPVYLNEMMERLGIDPAGGVDAHAGLAYMTALHRCQACSATGQCRAWLDRAPAEVTFAPRFCPNNDLLFEMQINQPGHIRGPTNDLCKAAKPARGRGET
jgi:hypothetical protein